MTVPPMPPTVEEIAAAVALAKQRSHYSMLAIIALVTVGIIAVVFRFVEGQGALGAQVIGVLAPTVAALLAYRKSAENSAAIHTVHLNIDGRLSQLLDRTDAAARAEGHAAGTADRTVRITDRGKDAGPAN